MSVNLGPLVLTVMQFGAAAAGFLLGTALLPPGTPYRRVGLLFGVVGAVVLASVTYRRRVRAALPASLGGDRTGDDAGGSGDDDGPVAPGAGDRDGGDRRQ